MTNRFKGIKRSVIIAVGIAPIALLSFSSGASAQMMGSYQGQNPPSQSDIKSEEDMQNAGQTIYKNLQNNKTSCDTLSNNDYEKLGEYFMGLSAGSTENHVYWDQRVQQMMGDEGDTQMHIVWGERGSGCRTDATPPANTPSFLGGMMDLRPTNTGGGGFMMGGFANASWSTTDTLLSSLLALAVIGGVYAWLYRRPRTEGSLNTLKKRYASGRISKQGFEDAKKSLSEK